MRRMPKSAVVVVGAGLVGLLVISAPLVLRSGYGVSDWLAWLDCAGEHPPTRHAPGFAEDRFLKVQRGMTKDEVQRLLGAPLVRRPWCTDAQTHLPWWNASYGPGIQGAGA